MAYEENHQYEGGLLGPAPGMMLQKLGTLAASNPDGTDLSPPLTNRQLALVLGAATSTLSDGLALVPFYHLVGGQLDAATSLPTGLTWTPESSFFALLQRGVPYQGFAELVDSEALLCGAVLRSLGHPRPRSARHTHAANLGPLAQRVAHALG